MTALAAKEKAEDQLGEESTPPNPSQVPTETGCYFSSTNVSLSFFSFYSF